MKKTVFLITLVSQSVLFFNNTYAGEPIVPESSLTAIDQFLSKTSFTLSTDFPYRINLFTQGQIDKNKAGLRIAEKAKQFASDKAGQIFYYQLFDNGMRVPHWHANAVEMGTVLSGKMRVTIWEGKDKPHVFVVETNQTWSIPQATLHALENVGQDKLTFIVAYNSPIAADRDFVTAWAALPDEILASAVGLTKEEISVIRKTTVNRLSSFDGAASTPELEENTPFSNSFDRTQPLFQSTLGSIKRVILNSDLVHHDMAMQQTIMKPGTLRLPHWYTAGDVLLFISQGKGFFTMMNDEGKIYQVLVKPGDLISLPMGTFHSYINIGGEDLVLYEMFNTAQNIEEISLLDGAKQFSAGVLQGATGLSAESAKRIAQEPAKAYIIPFKPL